MKQEFIQSFLNSQMFRKLTTTFSFLKKESLDQKEMEDTIKELKRGGMWDALKDSGQDPQEIADMALIAFDESYKKARERYVAYSKQIVEHLKNEIL
jgi:stress response protein SCP2